MGSFITINGLQTIPDTCKFSVSDLSPSSSGRDMSGIMHKQIIRSIRKLECTWGIMNWSKASRLLRAISPAEFNISYPDVMSGKMETRIFYAGDKSIPYLLYKDGECYINGVTVSFIEK